MDARVVLAGVDLAATAVALAAMIALHVLPTGLSPMRHAVSRYGISRYRAGYRVMTLALGAAGLALAGLLAVTLPAEGRTVTVGVLVVFAVCRLAISWWPMDRPGMPASPRGIVHRVLALGAFVAAGFAAHRLIAAAVDATPGADAEIITLQLAFWSIAAGLAGILLAAGLRERGGFSGAAERLVYVGIFCLLAGPALAAL